MTPAASIPGTRGNVTSSASPSRVCSSERFSPKTLTAIRTQPGFTPGTGSSVSSRFSTGPGPLSTTARIVFATPVHHPAACARPRTAASLSGAGKRPAGP